MRKVDRAVGEGEGMKYLQRKYGKRRDCYQLPASKIVLSMRPKPGTVRVYYRGKRIGFDASENKGDFLYDPDTAIFLFGRRMRRLKGIAIIEYDTYS